MKMIRRTEDEMVLQEGAASGIVVGVVFVLAGMGAGIFLHPVWIGVGLGAVGVAIGLFSSSITVVANRRSGELVHLRTRLVGKKSATYAIGDVFRIETRKEWRVENTASSQGQQTPTIVAQSVIVFKNGSEVALDHQKSSSTTTLGAVALVSGQGNETAMAAQVAEFLGVPFLEIAPPGMGGGVNLQF
jgi:hypothetical protein